MVYADNKYLPEKKQQWLGIDDLNDIFLPFGKIDKIMIFCRKETIKAFIEFSDKKTSKLARNNIHECCINNYGYIRVFYSNKEKLDLDNPHVEYKDYSQNNKKNSLLS